MHEVRDAMSGLGRPCVPDGGLARTTRTVPRTEVGVSVEAPAGDRVEAHGVPGVL